MPPTRASCGVFEAPQSLTHLSVAPSLYARAARCQPTGKRSHARVHGSHPRSAYQTPRPLSTLPPDRILRLDERAACVAPPAVQSAYRFPTRVVLRTWVATRVGTRHVLRRPRLRLRLRQRLRLDHEQPVRLNQLARRQRCGSGFVRLSRGLVARQPNQLRHPVGNTGHSPATLAYADCQLRGTFA